MTVGEGAVFRVPQGFLGGVFPICLDIAAASWVLCSADIEWGSWAGVGRCGGVFVWLLLSML